MDNNSTIATYLVIIRNDIFKLLPMKEYEGESGNLKKYLDNLICNLSGALSQFGLGRHKQFVYALTNLQFLSENKVEFEKWRRLVLNTVSGINGLAEEYKALGVDNGG